MAITKVINSESQAYRPVLTDTLVLDAVPTVNSFNGVTSDAVARAIAGASGEVPQVTENDNGKVLTAIYDEGGAAVEWSSAPNEVPVVGENDNAKVLTATYSEGTGSFAWAAAHSELPDTTGASQGDVLSIGSSGLEWATPSGGGSSSFTLTKVGTVTDYLPTTGGLSLSFTTVSGQSNFIDPTKLYILKVKVSCVDSGSLSFGSAPYLNLSSFNTEYNAVNRTHLSYAVPQINSGSMSSSASTNTTVYFFDEVANNLHIAPTGGQENDLKITVWDVHSGSANSHRITVDLYMVN